MARAPESMEIVVWSLLIMNGDNAARVAGINEHPFALAFAHIPNWSSLGWTLEIDPRGKFISIETHDSALTYRLFRHEIEVGITIRKPGGS